MSGLSSSNLSPLEIGVNVLTDPAVMWGAGSTILTLPVSGTASLMNGTRTLLSVATRLTTEFEKAGHPMQQLPLSFRRFARNRGASMLVNGMISCLSAAAAFYQAAQNGTGFQIPMGVALFGLSGLALGTSASLSATTRETLKNSTSAFGLVLGCAGLAVSAPIGTPATLYGLYALGAVAASWLAIRNKSASGWVQPDLMISATCAATAAYAYWVNDYYTMAANLMYALAFKSLDDLKKHGGVAEYVRQSSIVRTLHPS